jgi:hypothetical protein
MITLSSAKKRAEEFAAAVDSPTSSPARAELTEMVDLVTALRAQPAADATPRAEFAAALRERLMTEAEATWSYDPAAARLTLPAPATGRRERRLVVAATALVLTGGTVGMAAAAQQALPGEALYPMKRGIEDVRTNLTSDSATKGRTLLGQATNRLAEARTLVERSEIDPVVGSTLDTFRTQATDGSGLLLEAYEQSGEEAAVDDVRAFAADGLTELAELSELAPAELQGSIQDAALTLQEIELQAAEVCPTCGGDDAVAPVASAFSPALDAARVLAALRAGSLRNDHPLVSDRLSPDAPRKGDKRGSGADDGGETTPGDATGDLTGDGLPALPQVPGDVEADAPEVPESLQGAEDAVKKGADAVRKGVEEQVDKVGKTVDKTTDAASKTVDETVEGLTDPLEDPRLP